jgi:hypothetical protein
MKASSVPDLKMLTRAPQNFNEFVVQTCNEVCASLSGMRCDDAVQGSDITYTRESFKVAKAANPTGKGWNKSQDDDIIAFQPC